MFVILKTSCLSKTDWMILCDYDDFTIEILTYYVLLVLQITRTILLI